MTKTTRRADFPANAFGMTDLRRTWILLFFGKAH